MFDDFYFVDLLAVDLIFVLV